MKAKLLLIVSIAFFFQSFSQDSPFHLKNYKYRTPGYRALELGVNLSGSLEKRNYTTDQSNRQIELLPSRIQYFETSSTDKRIHNLSVFASPLLRFSSQKDGPSKYSQRDFHADFHLNINEKFYRNSQWFFELGNQLQNNFVTIRGENPTTTSKQNNLFLQNDLTVGMGKGRIELVNDAQMALFILEDLRRQGLLDRLPDASTVNEFARLITSLNNRRIFDSRRRRIYELSQIDAFIRQKGLTGNTDIRHFTTVNDNWALAFNPMRQSGSNWLFRILGTGGLNNNKQDIENSSPYTIQIRNHFFGVGPQVGYESYKPKNLKWQNNAGAFISWQYQTEDNTTKTVLNGSLTETIFASRRNQARFYGFYGFGYFPNNRTLLNTTINLEASHAKYHDPVNLKSVTTVRPSLHFITTYFLGYRTRLNAQLFVSYDHVTNDHLVFDKTIQHQLNSGFSVSLSHSIF